jgi:hypothetical protein
LVNALSHECLAFSRRNIAPGRYPNMGFDFLIERIVPTCRFFLDAVRIRKHQINHERFGRGLITMGKPESW